MLFAKTFPTLRLWRKIPAFAQPFRELSEIVLPTITQPVVEPPPAPVPLEYPPVARPVTSFW